MPPKEKLGLVTEEEEVHEAHEASDAKEVFLRDGRKLVVNEQGSDSLVEIRSESGLVEVRIQLTEAGPVLQMEAVRMELKASESVAIAAPEVTVNAEKLAITTTQDTTIDAGGEVRVVGTMIYLN